MTINILHARIDGQWFNVSASGVRVATTLEALAAHRGQRWVARVANAGNNDILCWGSNGYVSVSTGETASIEAVRQMPEGAV